MATPNYQHEKRQKALAKKEQDQKRQRRLTKESPLSQGDFKRPAESGQEE